MHQARVLEMRRRLVMCQAVVFTTNSLVFNSSRRSPRLFAAVAFLVTLVLELLLVALLLPWGRLAVHKPPGCKRVGQVLWMVSQIQTRVHTR